jgi:hypothetical protein
MKFSDEAKFTTLTPLSLIISSKLSFPIMDLKMSSLPTLALKSPNTIVEWYLGVYGIYLPIPHRSCISQHWFYPLLGHKNSKQYYETSDFSVLCMTFYH